MNVSDNGSDRVADPAEVEPLDLSPLDRILEEF